MVVTKRQSRRVTAEEEDHVIATAAAAVTFPFKLYEMLEYAADSKYSSAVSWSEDGTQFSIHDKDMLMKHVVPMFFKQSKFRSFTRQLNLWGFTRDTNSRAWQHEDFIRGSVELVQNIKRIEIKGKAIVSIKKKTSMKPQKKKHQSVATATRSSSRKPRPPIRHRVPSPGSVYTDSDGSLSIQDGTVISLSPVTEKNTIAKIPENVSTCLIPNNTFQSSGTHEAPAHTNSTTTPHDQYCHQAAAISYPTPIRTNITGNNNSTFTMSSSCQPYQMPLPRRDIMMNQHAAYSRPRDTIQHPSSMMMPPPHQPEEMNSNSTSDDMLFLLSGVFEPDQLSTQESNDLSSILSLNDDVSQDFMAPLRF